MEAIETTPCGEFCRELASAAPTPGGGGASALAGALAAALGGMVTSLTRDKKKYEAVQQDMLRLDAELEQLRLRLLALVEEDARAFLPLAAAYRLPSATPVEKAEKARVMEEALYNASLPPLEMLRTTVRVLEALEELAGKGSALAISDVGVGAALGRAALQGAILNLYINAASLQDRKKADELRGEAEILLYGGIRKADAIYEAVENQVNGGEKR